MARFISTSIPFVNGSPHLGHALEYVQADAMARYWRLRGHDVFFLTGSDENSLKNVLAAEAEGLATRRWSPGTWAPSRTCWASWR